MPRNLACTCEAHAATAAPTRHDFVEPDAVDQPVLVVIFLRGGADGLTLVPPTGDDRYYAARPTLSVAKADAIALDGYFSLHLHLQPLMKWWEQGQLSIIHGAGSNDESRSHFEAQDTMEHGGMDVGSGWLARYLRARPGAASALSAVAIGTTLPESLRGAPGGAVMQSVREFSFAGDDPAVLDALSSLYAKEQGPLGAAARDTIEAVHRLRTLRAETDVRDIKTPYPDSDFGRGLREIAMLVRAEVGLVTSTIDLGSWDTHFVQASFIDRLIIELGQGVDAFMTDLGPLRSRVTVAIMTEFGRRLRENTSFGTDHGAGGVMMLLGDDAVTSEADALRTGWPSLEDQYLDDIGDVPAAIDYRGLLAPVLQRHSPGIDLARVFPA